MIDFIHPKIKKIRTTKIINILVVLLVVVGSTYALRPVWPVISATLTKHSAQADLLPANLPPDDFVLENLHLPHNRIVERAMAAEVPENTNPVSQPEKKDVAQKTSNPNKPATTRVLGTSYNEEAKKQLSKTSAVNKIVIPNMGVDSTILEGNSEDMLWKGIWRMPVGSTPAQGGNTIITAHRYLHRPPSPKTFYLIDKMKKGDKITVFWEGVKYQYEVTESKIVEPTDTSILRNTASDQLTIFSCTPLFTSQQRLVVIAKKI